MSCLNRSNARAKRRDDNVGNNHRYADRSQIHTLYEGQPPTDPENAIVMSNSSGAEGADRLTGRRAAVPRMGEIDPQQTLASLHSSRSK